MSDQTFFVAEGTNSFFNIGNIDTDLVTGPFFGEVTAGNEDGLFLVSGTTLYVANLGNIRGQFVNKTAKLDDPEIGSYELTIELRDTFGGVDTTVVTVEVTPVDDPVALTRPIEDQLAFTDQPFRLDLPPDTFVDVDGGPAIGLSAELDGGGALPGWLAFDAGAQEFTGVPTAADFGVITVKVTATQSGESVADTFDLVVAPPSAYTLEVTTALDVVDFSDGVVSLREALILANTVDDVDRDPATVDTITFHEDLAGATIVLTQGALEIKDDVRIDGDVLGDTTGKSSGRNDDITITVVDIRDDIAATDIYFVRRGLPDVPASDVIGSIGDSRIFEVREDGTDAFFNALTLTGAAAYTADGALPFALSMSGASDGRVNGSGAAIFQADGSYGRQFVKGETDLTWPIYTSNPNYIAPVIKTTVTVTNSEISNNFGTAVVGGYRTTIEDSIMRDNDGGFGAAAVTGSAGGVFTLRNVDVVDHQLLLAPTTLGTASPNSSFLIYDSLIANNRQVDLPGGGFAGPGFGAGAIGTGSPGGEIKVVNSEVLGNQGVISGGIGTGSPSVKITIEDSLFEDNTARGDWLGSFGGGAVGIASNSIDLFVKNSDFIDNTNAMLGGGAIGVAATPNIVDIAGSNFVGNTSGAGGGALYFGGVNNKISVAQSTIVDNHIVADPIGPDTDLTPPQPVYWDLAERREFEGVPRVAGGVMANVSDEANAFFGGSYGVRIVNTVIAGNTFEGAANDLALIDADSLFPGAPGTDELAFFGVLTRDPITREIIYPDGIDPTTNGNGTFLTGIYNGNLPALVLFNDEPDIVVENSLIGTGIRDSFGALFLDNGIQNNLTGTPGNPLDPQLAAPVFAANGRLVLEPLAGSPLLDAGANSFLTGINTAGNGTTSDSLAADIAGNPRIADGNNNWFAVVDIGAAELAPLVIDEAASGIVNGGIAIDENKTAITTIVAPGADNFAIVGGADAGLFTIDGSGAFAFAAAPDFEAPADANDDNVYDVVVEVTSDTKTDTQAIAVTVADVDGVTIVGTKGRDRVNDSETVPGQPLPTGEEDLILGKNGRDKLEGLAGDDDIRGGGGKDILKGGADDDLLIGGRKKDKLIGGADEDTFLFNDKKAHDRAKDFTVGEDMIALDSGTFKKLDPGALKAKHFAKNKAKDGNDRIIYDKDYNKKGGALFYDKDGDGNAKAKLIVKLDGAPNLSADDLLIV